MNKQGELTRSGKRRSPGGKVLCMALAAMMLLSITASAAPWWLSKYQVTFDNELGIVGNVTTFKFTKPDVLYAKWEKNPEEPINPNDEIMSKDTPPANCLHKNNGFLRGFWQRKRAP